MYGSDDPAVKAAALNDQGRRNRGRKSIIKDAEKYAEELGLDISTDEGKIKSSIHEAMISQPKEAIARKYVLSSRQDTMASTSSKLMSYWM